MSPWLYLALAIGVELVGSAALKASGGFTRPRPTLVVLVCYGLSFLFFSRSLLAIPLGVAYAVWSGVGVAATAVIGVVVFRESLRWRRLAGMGLVIGGVVALNLSGAAR
jgi:small multidrug resistance pump